MSLYFNANFCHNLTCKPFHYGYGYPHNKGFKKVLTKLLSNFDNLTFAWCKTVNGLQGKYLHQIFVKNLLAKNMEAVTDKIRFAFKDKTPYIVHCENEI